MAKNIKFVKRANMWCAYWTKDQKGISNEIYWFSSKESAQAKLDELIIKG